MFHDPTDGLGRPTLADPGVRALLADVWLQPLELDPSRKAAKVTRGIADRLAKLARAMENKRVEAGREVQDHDGEDVAMFLMRCLFTMFAEDVGLLPNDSFRNVLERLRATPHVFAARVTSMWREMRTGAADSGYFGGAVPHFSGKLFEHAQALPVSAAQLDLLIDAAKADWKDVEPAIFGTLLERALDPKERHKLGAHYTPRAYVERLVLPTVIEPLRDDWQTALTEAMFYLHQGRRDSAIDRVRAFHKKLCETKVLDPACGSGNFLYVTLEHMKRLEGEVLQQIADLQQTDRAALVHAKEWSGETVGPWQFKGIELNPRAAVLAEVVLWIGYLQWHFKVVGGLDRLPQPILRELQLVDRRDAVLAWDERRPRIDPETGRPVTQWDGVSTKKHPVTGLDVPDESRTRVVEEIVGARKADWPLVDFVVGNPPFIGNKRMRVLLGDGYVEALRKAHSDVPETVDFVMYWWDSAAQLLNDGKVKRFGFITTNSITQSFNRQVTQAHLKSGLALVFAVADHPWVEAKDGADVRVAMTVVATAGTRGVLVIAEDGETLPDGEVTVGLSTKSGLLHADLSIGAATSTTHRLLANRNLSYRGVIPHGEGMLLTCEQAAALGLGRVNDMHNVVRPYCNGRDIAQSSRQLLVIDLFPARIDEVIARFPELYQHLVEYVKPHRDQQKDKDLREKWWLHRRNNEDMRRGLAELPRFIATLQTSRHRYFVFLDARVLPDDKLIAIGSDDGTVLGILSSRLHTVWALRTGGWLGVGNDPVYNKLDCFEKFPFPATTETHQTRIRTLAEDLDAHRKRQQAQHPDLTLTGMYNVLQSLREGRPLTDKERKVHDQGLCTVLRKLHDDLDAAVFAAYDWPADLDDEAILQRLVDLNAERADEERRGHVRWLRPEFQNPGKQVAVAQSLALAEAEPADEQVAVVGKVAWPKKPVEMLAAVKQALAQARGPQSAQGLAQAFDGAQVLQVEALLAALEAAGTAVEVTAGTWVVV